MCDTPKTHTRSGYALCADPDLAAADPGTVKLPRYER